MSPGNPSIHRAVLFLARRANSNVGIVAHAALNLSFPPCGGSLGAISGRANFCADPRPTDILPATPIIAVPLIGVRRDRYQLHE
jgi:hypothetical protein